ncbi:hypothetical protein NDU88_004758 [Pleurodeles waltl]|uniref:Uncharacterized protein n=1 Tax=Pleurodeles waltl TaxID=8319 RepID=A0AAV7NTD7_PLEWA|nr:hypothetical protein NDU88_004758 [Pleurodeles waltl]
MDTKISDLVAETKSIHTNINDFRRFTAVKDCLNTIPARDQEMLYLWEKLTDWEDQNRRDNVCFFGFPEHGEEADVKGSLKGLLPYPVGLTFTPALELQRAHHLGPAHQATPGGPRPLIACFLHHEQAEHLLAVVQTHDPYVYEGQKICNGR